MAKATIWIEDNEDGSGMLNVGADFGDAVDQDSQAHSMAMVLIESVLKNAKSYSTVEDTVPEHNIEPSLIITADKAI
jgi:hypothetical protein